MAYGFLFLNIPSVNPDIKEILEVLLVPYNKVFIESGG